MSISVVVVGASGFLGSEVLKALREQGCTVVGARAPRVGVTAGATPVYSVHPSISGLEEQFAGAAVVVNCAGNPDASEQNVETLIAANASSAEIVAKAAVKAGVRRLVHVSSAVVQGRRSQLDESEATEEFSPYAHSKAEGERLVRQAFPGSVVYRPPSVHARGRRVTEMTARIAASPFSSVASPGNQHSPQALIGNVASAIAFLATTSQSPPSVVIHPWEGLTTVDVMELLGDKRPLIIPRPLAKAVCSVFKGFGSFAPGVAANARRVEMLWFGQDQANSWLTDAGWIPPYGRDAWIGLGGEIRESRR